MNTEHIKMLEKGQCTSVRVQCRDCGEYSQGCFKVWCVCSHCGSRRLLPVSEWYGQPVPEGMKFYKWLSDGQRYVPKYYVEVRAYLNPVNDGDQFLSWLAAEKWFEAQGMRIMENSEWEEYKYQIPGAKIWSKTR